MCKHVDRGPTGGIFIPKMPIGLHRRLQAERLRLEEILGVHVCLNTAARLTLERGMRAVDRQRRPRKK
jgi:hypothetical protein